MKGDEPGLMHVVMRSGRRLDAQSVACLHKAISAGVKVACGNVEDMFLQLAARLT